MPTKLLFVWVMAPFSDLTAASWPSNAFLKYTHFGNNVAAFSKAALVLFTKSAARKIRSLDSNERLAFRKKVVRSYSGRGEDVKAPPGLGITDEAKDGEAMVVCSESNRYFRDN